MAQIIRELANEGNDFGDKANEYLEKMAEDLDKGYDTSNDEGQNLLLDDLANLLYEAWHYEFHDFKNKKYAAPKVQLKLYLEKLEQNVVNGRYDNKI